MRLKINFAFSEKAYFLNQKLSQRIHWWLSKPWSAVITLTPTVTEQEPLWKRSDEQLSNIRLFGLTPDQLQKELQHYWSKPRWQQWLLRHFTFIHKKIQLWVYYNKCLAFRALKERISTDEIIKSCFEIDNLSANQREILAKLESWLNQQEIGLENCLDSESFYLKWNEIIATNYQLKNFLISISKYLTQEENAEKELEIFARIIFQNLSKDLIKYHYLWQQKAYGLNFLSAGFPALQQRPTINQVPFEQILECALFRRYQKNHTDHTRSCWIIASLYATEIFTPQNLAAIKSHSSPEVLVTALVALYESGLLTAENFELIKGHANPESAAYLLVFLYWHGLLTLENRMAISARSYLSEFKEAFKILLQIGLLNSETIAALFVHQKPLDLAKAYKLLSRKGIITPEYIKAMQLHRAPIRFADALYKLYSTAALSTAHKRAIQSHPEVYVLVCALLALQSAGLFTAKNFETLRTHEKLGDVTDTIEFLSMVGMLSEENFEAVKSHRRPTGFVLALMSLYGAGMLKAENFEIMQRYPAPNEMAAVLNLLYAAKILNQRNFEAVQSFSEPVVVASALHQLHSRQILDQRNFSALLQHRVLLSGAIWDRLPLHIVTLEVFNEFLQRARQANPEEQIQAYVAYLLNNNPDNALLNDSQSAHTASVHQSVSESASKLLARYGAQIQGASLACMVSQLTNFINGISDEGEKNKAAKRRILRITAIDYIFIDKRSKVSLRQLLALVYLAILDENHREGSLQDAKKMLIEALYEIQCGYNLSEQGQYLGGEDRCICISGTFNKLIEKLHGIHSDCKVRFVNSRTVSLKLPIIVQEQSLAYLLSLASPDNRQDFLAFTQLIQRLKTQGIEVIWNSIKESVMTKLFDEFSDFYQNKENKDLLALVHEGQCAALSDKVLTIFEETIRIVKGDYQNFSYLLQRSGLFSASLKNNKMLDSDKRRQEKLTYNPSLAK